MKGKNFGQMLDATVKAHDKVIADKFENADKELARHQPLVSSKTPSAKILVVRHSFSMPASDYVLIEALRKKAVLENRITTSISEIIRAGVHAISRYEGLDLIVAIERLEHLRPGRKS